MLKTKLFETVLRQLPRPYITDAELVAIMDGTADSRYGKVKRLLAQGKLMHIRRGLYCLTNEVGCLRKPHPYELAQYIYGPSYISLESALAFHQLIPEAVYTTTCATTKRSKTFETPLGQFSYSHLPVENFYIEVDVIKQDGYQYLMAKPWKAICDYIFCSKKEWQGIEPFLDSLRIDMDELPELSFEQTQRLVHYYRHSRVSRFLRDVQKNLNNRLSKEIVK